VVDSDWRDDSDVTINLSFGLSAKGFGFSVGGLSIPIDIDGDNSEASSVLAAGFASANDWLGGGADLPAETAEKKIKSSDYFWEIFETETMPDFPASGSTTKIFTKNQSREADFHFFGCVTADNTQSPVSDNTMPYAKGTAKMKYKAKTSLLDVIYEANTP
jgi:hypothetical protein